MLCSGPVVACAVGAGRDDVADDAGGRVLALFGQIIRGTGQWFEVLVAKAWNECVKDLRWTASVELGAGPRSWIEILFFRLKVDSGDNSSRDIVL
jgi:hypothetical protein